MYQDDYLPMPADAPEYDYMMDEMHPEVYKRIKPYVENIAVRYQGGPLTEEDLESMTQEAVTASNIMRDPPRGHNASTLRDVARGLLLGTLLGRRRRPEHYYPIYPPIFYPPYYGWHGRPGPHR